LGLNADDYCVILPRLGPNEFVAAAGLCDVMLDSIGWSGFNSTMESLAHDLPIVTLAGRFVRSRHSSAILKMMGLDEFITTDIDSFVAGAVRLGVDREWRTDVKTLIAGNKHRLYRDRSCISALEDFLERAVRNLRVDALGNASATGHGY